MSAWTRERVLDGPRAQLIACTCGMPTTVAERARAGGALCTECADRARLPKAPPPAPVDPYVAHASRRLHDASVRVAQLMGHHAKARGTRVEVERYARGCLTDGRSRLGELSKAVDALEAAIAECGEKGGA